MISYIEILNKSYYEGELVSADDFNMRVWKVASKIVKEYKIKYDPENIIPCDNTLADDVFNAGLELFLELGVYNISSQRVIRIDESDVKEYLKNVRDEITIGAGKETRILRKREVEDTRPPMILGGVIEGNPEEGEPFIKLYETIAREPLIDGIYFGPPTVIKGVTIVHDSPLEVIAAANAVKWIKDSLQRVNRPGLHLISAQPSAIGDMTAFGIENGLTKTDAIAIPIISEMKTDNAQLSKVAYALENDIIPNPYRVPMVGGFAGGPEGTALVGVASLFMALIIYQGYKGYINFDVIRVMPPGSTAREALWVRSIVGQATQRNTKAISGAGLVTYAGPGTEMMFYEIAAGTITHTVSGFHVMHGVRKTKLTKPNQCSGLESKWEAEVAYASTKLKREEANEIVKILLKKYEDKIRDAPEGLTFGEIYDWKTLKIKPQVYETYIKIKKELADLGLDFSIVESE